MERKYYDLTNPQQSIWLTEQFYKDTAINHICGTVLLHEVVDFDLLKKAIETFVKDNDSFRLKLTFDNTGNVQQYISSVSNFPVSLVSLNTDEDLKKLEKDMVSAPISLIDNLLFCFKMFQFSNGHGGFVITAHHLISDACTAGLLASKIINIYTALLQKEDNPVVATSYLSYIDAEKEYLSSEKFEKDKAYWDAMFETIPEIGVIPSVHASTNDSCIASRELFVMPCSQVERIQAFCVQNKVSIFNFFMAVYAIYIGRVSQLDDFVLGTPILNRTTYTEKNTPGMFISTVPFRFCMHNESSFSDFIKTISMDALAIFRHQKYPYRNILEHIRAKNPSQPNLYDILISYQNTRTNKNTAAVDYDVRWTFNNFVADAMQIHLFDMNDEGSLNIAYDYRLSKYSKEDITDIHARILYMIEQILSSDDLYIQDIEIVTPEERQKLLYDFNDTQLIYDKNKTLVDFFEEQVAKNPNHIALVFENQQLTYAQLNQKANQLAYVLLRHGIKRGDILGVLLERSCEMIVGLLAIIKIGATYLPLDPHYPVARISYILKDSQAKFILLHHPTMDLIDDSYAKLDISFSSSIYTIRDIKNLNTVISPDDILYVIYTSGSTGNPKGVMITYGNMTNFILAVNQVINFSPQKVMLSVTTISFDIFALEIWCSFANGLSVVLCNELEQNSPALLRDLCIRHHVTMIQTTPSRFTTLLSDKNNLDYFNHFTDIMVGGEPFPILLLQKLKQLTKANIFNMYGPTETTIWSTIKDLTYTNQITIGTPIANTVCYILDGHQKLLPPNVPGNLYIGGDGVSKGYFHKEVLTEEMFISSPFIENHVIYNTNDLAYMNKNGEVVHLGRTDFQVKIRGYRIELSEIESKILDFPEVKNAIVIPKNSKFLVCYYVAEKEIPSVSLTTYLLRFLPNYMIPSYYIKLKDMPLTPNGKVDRKQLPSFEIPCSNLEYASTPTQSKLSEVLSHVLKTENLDINTPFLNLGLDSLGIIQAQTELLPYHFSVTTQDFYRYPSIKQLASKIDSHLAQTNEQSTQVPALLKHSPDEIISNTSYIDIHENCLQNIFLTGANGFLGIHILYELLKTTQDTIYCLVRGNNYMHSVQRLANAYEFYFHESFSSYLNKRVFVIHGDIEKSDLGIDTDCLNNCISYFSTVIHTAAIVKHYGSYSDFEKINVNGTKNVADFAYKYHKKLVHISSISVSGNYLVRQDMHTVTEFSENALYIGQHYYDNVYVHSKLEAEKVVYTYAEKGLPVQVLRIGILAGRYSDGVFQEKIEENAFYNRIRTMIGICAVTEEMLQQEIEFTPVDYCAQAIVLLSKNSLCWNKIFHLYNPHFTHVKDIVKVLQDFNIHVKVLDNMQFDDYIQKLSKESSKNYLLGSIINDIQYDRHNLLSINYNYTVPICSNYTQNYLHLLNFNWPMVSDTYIKKLLTYMQTVHFI